MSYDRFHDNADKIYRIILDQTVNGVNRAKIVTTFVLGPAGKETIPEIPSAIPMPGEAETDLPVIDTGEEPAGDLPFIDSGSDEEGAGTAGDSGDPSDSGN